jgi:hypothetical protein
LEISSNENSIRLFLGNTTNKFILNLSGLLGIESMPSNQTTDTFSHGYNTSSHMIGRQINASVLRGSGGGVGGVAISFNGGVNYGNDNKLAQILTDGTFLVNQTSNNGVDRLQVNGSIKSNSSIQVGDNTATASSTNVGAIRYRTSGNNSYAEMSMQTSASTYTWVVLKTNNW